MSRVSNAQTSSNCTTLAGDPCTAYTQTTNVPIVMDDGVVLESDVYTPTPGCPCPTVVIFTPYGKESALATEADLNWPEHGYAEVVVDVRGTGASEGYWGIFSTREQQDYAEVVRWAAAQPFSDGHIVLSGASYAAIAALLAAEQPDTGAISALFIGVPLGDAYRDIFSAGGQPDSEFLTLWALGLVSGESLYEPLQSAQSDPQVELNAESEHLYNTVTSVAPLIADTYLGSDASSVPQILPGQMDDASYDGPFYRERSPITKIGSIRSPVFIIGVDHDIFQRTEPMLFNSLPLPTSEKKLIIQPGYHRDALSGLTGTYDTGGFFIPSTAALELQWADHWARGTNNGIQDFPPIEHYFTGIDKFVPEQSEPPAGISYEHWYLDARASGSVSSLYDGSLEPGSIARDAGQASAQWDPFTGVCSRNTIQYLYGLVPDNACSTDESTNDRTALTFTTAPFENAYSEVGPMVADLWITSTAPDTNVVAIVSDVAPDGTADQLTYGTLMGSQRALVTTPCTTAEVLDCSMHTPSGGIIVPWHPFTRASQEALVPGVPYELEVEIFPSALVLQPGHRLRLSLLTGDFPHSVPTTSLVQSAAGGTTTFLFDAKHPSSLYLGTTTPSSQP